MKFGAAETFRSMIARVISIFLYAWPAFLGTCAVSQRVGEDPNSTLPDAPSAQVRPTEGSHQPYARLIILVKRRSYCFPDLALSTAPPSAGQKFSLFLNESISGHSIAGSAASAGVEQGFNWFASYGQGAAGFGKRFGASLARTTSNSFFGTFLLATVLRQDPRFFVPSNPTFWQAVKYSLRRVVITRTDSGAPTLNSSGLLGSLAGEGIASVYLPLEDRTLSNTVVRYGSDMGWLAAENVLRAYWPTITKHVLSGGK